jgi:hypothetical protein
MKNNEEMAFDKLSYADYAVAAAFTTIQAAQGPVMLDQYFYGRKDAVSESECGPASVILPQGGDFVSNLQAMDFSEEEIVALASIEAFGLIVDPEHSRWSDFGKLDNYYYKQLLSQTTSQELPHKQALIGNQSLQEHIEKFAQDKKAYHKTFKQAFVKLSELGSNPEELIDIEEFIKDDPRFKLNYP